MTGLIIGLGSIGQKHIEASLISKYDIKWFALRHSIDSLNAEGVTNIYNENNIPEIDFVLISNPTNLHYKSIKSVIKLNKPIFIEKPVLSDLQNVSLLKKIIYKKNIQTYVACNLRFHPVIQWIKENVKNNTLGKIEEVNIYCGSYLPDWRPGRNYKDIYSADADKGGGAHLDLIHELDYSYWIFGTPHSVTSGRQSSSHIKINSIDYAVYWLNHKVFNINVSLNYFRKDTKRTIEIVTDKGTYFADILTCSIKKDNTVIFENKSYNVRNTYVNQLNYFFDTINNKSYPFFNTFANGVSVLEIALTKNIWKD